MNVNTLSLDWKAENAKDAQMLGMLALSPLDASCVEGDDEVVQLVERHNATLAGLKERFGRLAEDRQPLCDADKWRGSDSGTVIAARKHVLAESWDAVLALRNALDEREALLRRMEANVQARLPDLIERREKAYAKAHKALEREYRDYLKAEPHRGAAHVAGLAQDDETVAPLRQEIGRLENIIHSLQEAYYKAGHRLPVTTRQREIFPHLN